MIKKIRNSKGFTLAELLLAVAIISILSAVSFVNVTSYMRNMKQLELDGYAKEIFMSAQNHLIMAESNGYYGRSTDDNESGYFGTPAADSTYYFVSPYTDSINLKNTLLYRMVPPGSIDVGNINYIIRYDLNTGRVLDIFCTEKEDTSRYGFDLQGKYDELLKLRGDNKKEERKDYGENKSVIGYYGGTEPISIDSKIDNLKAPEVSIVNGDELTATVKVNENLSSTIKLVLHIEGLQSGSIREFILYNRNSRAIDYDNVTDGENLGKEWSIELDRIKGSPRRHFGELFSELLSENDAKFLAGEDLSLQAYIFDTSKISNRAFGNIEITNSLFGNYTEITKVTDSLTNSEHYEVAASIENLRHLENLSYKVSNVNTSQYLVVDKANQVKNIIMPDSGFNVILFGSSAESKGLMPIYTGKELEYEGNNFSLKKIYIESETDEDAGIFGKLESGSKVTNLHIINPSITGNNSVGALVGESGSSELSGVYVYEKDGSSTIESRDGTAGGLVGKMNGGSITGCFASVLVKAKDNAGGLIGEADGSSVKASYSGGHTKDGEYQTDRFNITAERNAGGLIGNANNSTVQYCYSTCSASGSVAGGFVGSVSSKTIEIKNCYCTGLVNGSTNAGGFSGIYNTAYDNEDYCSNNRYFETVVYDYDSQIKEAGGIDVQGIRPMDPDTVDITVWDTDYDDFTDYENDDASDAVIYDTEYIDGLSKSSLVDHYNQKYPFKTIDGNNGYRIYTEDDLPNTDPDMMKKHYGDWPIAETIVTN